MICVISFKDGQEESILRVKSVTDFGDRIEIRTNDLDVIRYPSKEIVNMSLVQR